MLLTGNKRRIFFIFWDYNSHVISDYALKLFQVEE